MQWYIDIVNNDHCLLLSLLNCVKISAYRNVGVFLLGTMEQKEILKVHIKYVDGKTVCMCLASRKKCSRECPLDEVTRDRYKGWQQTMNGKY